MPNYTVLSLFTLHRGFVFLQVITMILTKSSHSKECFCRFVAKLRCCQVFLKRKRSSPVCSFITLIVAVSYSNESFSSFSPKLQCPDLFSHCKRFSALRSYSRCFNLNLKHNNSFAFRWKFRLFSALWHPTPSLCFFLLLLSSFYFLWRKTAFLAFFEPIDKC